MIYASKRPCDMKATLIYLPKPYLKEPEAQAPLGLMYLAAVLEEHEYGVELKNYPAFTDEEAIADLGPADLYGITVTSLEVPQANRFAAKIKQKFPNAKVVLGGPGAYHEEFVDWSRPGGIDAVCKGEGEHAILEIMRDVAEDKLKRVYIGEPVMDLDTLPLPARHLLSGRQGGNIFAYDRRYVGGDTTVILSTRGCPFECAFCSSPFFTYSNRFRARSPRHVAGEIDYVVREYGVRQFRFSDDMFTAGKRRVLDLCEAIGPLDVIWRISCRVKPLDEEMLAAMWQAGCRELSFGIESFDDAVLSGLNKKTTCQDNVRALKLSAEVGYRTRMLFMIRTPFQTRRTIEINKHWIQRVPFTIMACTSFIPIPGSDVWFHPDKYNVEILDRDLDKYNFYMFGPEGKRDLDPILKIKDRPLDEFMSESEEFRSWVQDYGKVNKG